MFEHSLNLLSSKRFTLIEENLRRLNNMAQGMTSTKRFVVRTAMVTGTTLATIFGSQSLAAFDQANNTVSEEPINTQPNNTILVLPTETTSFDAPAVAPSIVILRHQGEQSATVPAQTVTQPNRIAPPSPVQIAPPQPVIQQVIAPSVPITRSSRR